MWKKITWERGGMGAQTRGPDFFAPHAEQLKQSKQVLFRALNTHTTVAFIGSGCSVPLGYPTWFELARLAVVEAIAALRAAPDDSAKRADLPRLLRFEKQLAARQASPQQLTFILRVCQRILEALRGRQDYLDFLSNIFKPRPLPLDASANPYPHLLELPIDRFVTSNYDDAIEQALSLKRHIPFEEYKLRGEGGYSKRKHRAFTQQDKHYDQLALFALSRVDEARHMVFHCHGHYDEPESMIVTESDYQRWYLREKPEASAFRQTVDLLFSSNPILFVGFGLSDEDLMRSLRLITANRLPNSDRQPLFALLPETEEGADADQHDALYERYGVNVIPFTSPTVEGRGQDLAAALAGIKEGWHEWWDDFLKKPKMRRVKVTEQLPHPYHHYPIRQERNDTYGGDRLDSLLLDLKKEAQEGRKVLALTGRGGSGKSWCAQQLMHMLVDDSEFKGFFFWSSYYANDALSGLDRALLYLDPRREFGGSRLERFAQCLKRDKYFLVFDGIERFLVEGQSPDSGVGFSPEARQFLKLLSDPDSKSTVVLTSRLWPEELGCPRLDENPEVRRFPTLLFTTDDIVGVAPFNLIPDRKDVSALCSLIEGHIYCIALAAHLLRAAGPEGAAESLKNLQRNLANTPPDRRTQRMIREAILALDRKWDNLALKLLERVALFMSPVGGETVDAFCASAGGDDIALSPENWQSLIDDLVGSHLLQETINLLVDTDALAYTVHPIVRTYIFEWEHRALFSAPPSFTLPGFTSKTVVVDPGVKDKGVRVVLQTIEDLEAAAERAYQAGRPKEAIALCRGMFSVMRARMGSNTVPRWHNYDSYISLIARLWDVAKKVSPELWAYAEQHDLDSVEDEDGPLYADEMAWLYNEVGLAAFSEGVMLNALSVWEQGYEINKIIDSEPDSGRYTFQSQINLGAGYIHAGRLNIAERYLREAKKTNFVLDDEDHLGRVVGYLALVKHLQGNLKEAQALYEEAHERLLRGGGNIRAECIFSLHHADLKMRLGELDKAKGLIQQGQYLAEAGYFPDLVAYAQNGLGHWHRVKKDMKSALAHYSASLNEARRIGLRRLESDVLAEQSQMYYDLGDPDVARQKAIEALKIANEASLGLKQSRGLVALGQATIQAGHQALGISYLKHGRKLAHQQGYFLKKSDAEIALRQHGEEPEVDDVN